MLELNKLLVDIFSKRIGGVSNLNGIAYQLNFALLKLLNLENSNQYVQLEGIEDIDLGGGRLQDESTFCQLKYSHLEKDRLTASKLIDKNTLKNFGEVYQKGVPAKFKIIHNHKITDPNLKPFVTHDWSFQTVDFWKEKFNGELDMNDFLNKVTIEYLTEKKIEEEVNKKLISRLNTYEKGYMALKNALFVNAFTWSRQRRKVFRQDIDTIFTQHIELIASGIQNDAIKYKFIEKVDFELITTRNGDDYFEGKAAQPIHIAQKLPIERPQWKSKIIEVIENFDVVIVKSSSGQGKSTLAWQVAEYYSKKGHSIYQIHSCRDEKQVGSLLSHIETLTQILGEILIIVIDGLSSIFKDWSLLAARLFNLPVKIIVTTREEDWFRFGSESHHLRQEVVEIGLSYQEAGEIFAKFQKEKSHLLATNIKTFQPAWKQVENRKLLIEYVYYLTQGQMLETRLREQLKTMHEDIDNKAKKEILRFIALADCCNIRLKTGKLLSLIERTVGIQGDKHEMLGEIEKEYAINFSQQLIEGLHPVRSEHILKLLLRDPSDPIVQFLTLLNENELGNFFAFLPNLLADNYSREELFERIASQLGSQSFISLSNALDGLYIYSVMSYWLDNKAIFDEAFQHGGFILFMMMVVPYPPADSMNELSDLLSGIKNLQNKANELSPFSIDNTDFALLSRKIFSRLSNQSINTNLIGLDSLLRWLEMINLPVQDLQNNIHIDIRKYFETNSFDQTASTLSELGKLKVVDFEGFAVQNQEWLISLYKKETDTPTVEIREDNSVHIEYMTDPNEEDTNGKSVKRLELLMKLLPQFEKYTSKAIVFPFPGERIAYYSHIGSEQTFTHKTFYDDYKIRANQLFSSQIEAKYAAQSAYEWQKNWTELREAGVDLVKIACRTLEDVLENKKGRFETDVSQLDKKGDVYLQKDKATLQPPFIQQKNDLVRHKNELYNDKILQKWSSNLGNFVRQFSNLFSSKATQHDKYLVLCNFRDTYQELNVMQSSFDKNCDISRNYFADVIPNLCNEENFWYGRLKNALEYFYENWVVKNERQPVLLAKNACVIWKQEKQQEILSSFIKGLEEIQLDSPLLFYFPNNLIDDGNYTTIAFGAMGLAGKTISEDDFWALFAYIALLFYDFNIDYIIIIPVNNGIAQQNAMRVQKSFLEDLKKAIDEDRVVEEMIYKHRQEPLYSNLPTPMIINQRIANTIDDLIFDEYLLKDDQKDLYNLIFNLWKIGEYRKRLNVESEIEAQWLENTENTVRQKYDFLIKNSSTSVEVRKLVQETLYFGKIYDAGTLISVISKFLQI